MNTPSDSNLVSAIRQGQVELFDLLVRRYQNRVYGVTMGILADFHLARDAAQEAFLCAYSQIDRLKSPDRFGAWLCGIARNSAMEVRRGHWRQDALARKAGERKPPEPVGPTDELAAEREERRIVKEALLRIGDKDREALTLYYSDGMKYAEICTFLGVSLGTLKGRLQRGRSALRKELTMIEHTCKTNVPDEAFRRSLADALAVFGASGPATSHIPSTWHDSLREETGRLLESGQEGFRVDIALSHSGSARQRGLAASRFGIRRDPQSLAELERMLVDRSARVRRGALVWYAAAVHPDNRNGWVEPFDMGKPSATRPPGIDAILTLADDENHNVRMAAVRAIGAYRDANHPRVGDTLQRLLDDPKHKVRHATARLLGVPCTGCGSELQNR